VDGRMGEQPIGGTKRVRRCGCRVAQVPNHTSRRARGQSDCALWARGMFFLHEQVPGKGQPTAGVST
jgi:hypothetical protein